MEESTIKTLRHIKINSEKKITALSNYIKSHKAHQGTSDKQPVLYRVILSKKQKKSECIGKSFKIQVKNLQKNKNKANENPVDGKKYILSIIVIIVL